MPLRKKPKNKLFVALTHNRYVFINEKANFINNCKQMLAVYQLKRHRRELHPGIYSVEIRKFDKLPKLVFQPVRQN